jgi:hypothetical protein
MQDIGLYIDSLSIDTTHLELTLRVLLQVLLLGSSAVFSGSATAMFSLSRIDLHRRRRSVIS